MKMLRILMNIFFIADVGGENNASNDSNHSIRSNTDSADDIEENSINENEAIANADSNGFEEFSFNNDNNCSGLFIFIQQH